MSLKDWLNGKRLRISDLEFVSENGSVAVPEWQFALLIAELEDTKGVVLVLVVVLALLVILWLFVPFVR